MICHEERIIFNPSSFNLIAYLRSITNLIYRICTIVVNHASRQARPKLSKHRQTGLDLVSYIHTSWWTMHPLLVSYIHTSWWHIIWITKEAIIQYSIWLALSGAWSCTLARRPRHRQRRPWNQVFNKHLPEDPYRQSGQHQLPVGAASMNLIQWRKHGPTLESVCKTMPPRASHRQGPICTPTGRRIFCSQGLAQLFLLGSLIRQIQACSQTQCFIILRTHHRHLYAVAMVWISILCFMHSPKM